MSSPPPLSRPRSTPYPTSNLPPPIPGRRRRPRAAPYIPPFRQRRIDAARPSSYATDSVVQLRLWTAMKKRINGVINRVNHHNVPQCALDLFRINLVRGRGVFCRAVLRAQLASPSLSPVFAALVAVVGSRMPQVAELLLNRLLKQYRKAYRTQDRTLCFATAKFLAHLFNQQVVTELLLLELVFTCILNPSDGSIELAAVTLKECAVLLAEKSPKALEDVFERLRQLLHDGQLNKRAQVLIEDLMQLRRSKFEGVYVLPPSLDLLEQEDIITHFVSLQEEDKSDLETDADEFAFDPQYEENEEQYLEIKKDILGAAVDDNFDVSQQLIKPIAESTEELDGAEKAVAEVVAGASGKRVAETPKDMTDAESTQFRRDVYLILTSGLTYEEWAHKLLHLMKDHPTKEPALSRMIVECCSHDKTYIRGYGLLGQRLCMRSKAYVSGFEDLFATYYASIHKYDTKTIRLVACFFASLFASESLQWTLFQLVRIVEDETTASSRIFLKNLFKEIASTMGTKAMTLRFEKARKAGDMVGVLPTDKRENSRFAIDFFSGIELAYLVEDLRESMKNASAAANDANDEVSSSSALSSSSSESSVLSESSGEEEEIAGRGQAGVGSREVDEGFKNGNRISSDMDKPIVRESEKQEMAGRGMAFGEIEEGHRAYIASSAHSVGKRSVLSDGERRKSPDRKRRRYDSPGRERGYRRRSYRSSREPRGYWNQSGSDAGENDRDRGEYRRQRGSNESDFDERRNSRRARERRHRRRRSQSRSDDGHLNSDAYYSNDSRDRIGRRRRDGDDSDSSGGRYERRIGRDYSR